MMSPPAHRPPADVLASLSGGSSASASRRVSQQASSPLAAPPISASTAESGSSNMFARTTAAPPTPRTGYAAPSTPASDNTFAALLGAESPGTFLHNLTAAAASMQHASTSTAQPPTLHRGASSQSLMNPPRAPSRASSKVGSRSNTPRGNTASASDDEEEEEGSSPLDDDEEEEDEDEDIEDDLQQKPPSHWPLDPSMLGLPFPATPGPSAGGAGAATPAAAAQAGTTPGGGTADAPTPGVAELDQIIGHLINYIGTTAPSAWDAGAGATSQTASSPSAAQMQEQVRSRRSTAGGAASSSSAGGSSTGRGGKAAPVHPVVLANLIARINGQPIAGELPPMSELDPAVVLQGLLEWREQRHEQHRGLANAANASTAAASTSAPSDKQFNTWAHDQAKLQREQAEQQAVFDQQLQQVVNNKDAANAAALGFDPASFSFANFDFGENDDVDEDPDFDPEAWTRAFGSSPVSILTPLPGFTPQAHGGTPNLQQQQPQHTQTGPGLLTHAQLQGHTNLQQALQRGSHSDAGTPYGAIDASMPPPTQQQQQRVEAQRAMSLGGASPADALSPLVWGNAQVDLGGPSGAATSSLQSQSQQQQQQAQRSGSNVAGPSAARREPERERERERERDRDRGGESSRRSSNEGPSLRREERSSHVRSASTSRRRSASPPPRRRAHEEASDDDADSSPSKQASSKGKGKSSSSFVPPQRETSHFEAGLTKMGRPPVEETEEEKRIRRKEQNRINSARARARQKEVKQARKAQGHGKERERDRERERERGGAGSSAKAKAEGGTSGATGAGGGGASGQSTSQLLSENRFLREEVERLRDENAQLRADLALEQRMRSTTSSAAAQAQRGSASGAASSRRERSGARSRREEREWDANDARRGGADTRYLYDSEPRPSAAAASTGRWASSRGTSRYADDDEESVGSYDEDDDVHHDDDDDDEDDDDGRERERGREHDDARSYCSALEYSDEQRPTSRRTSGGGGGSKRTGGAGGRRLSPERPSKRARGRGGTTGNELDILVQAAEASYRHPQQGYRG